MIISRVAIQNCISQTLSLCYFFYVCYEPKEYEWFLKHDLKAIYLKNCGILNGWTHKICEIHDTANKILAGGTHPLVYGLNIFSSKHCSQSGIIKLECSNESN